MKKIDKYIQENKELLSRRKATLKNNCFSSEDAKRLEYNINNLYWYIKGLEDSKNMILENKEVK
jgi:hypothetical protein